MQVNSVSTVNNRKIQQRKDSNSPSFKGLGNFPGAFMQGLENSGFIGSFLAQDFLGMTTPRTIEGLRRDVPKEKRKNVKDLNFKEGAEVFIRESLSGPLMVFTPVLVLMLGKKMVGKTSFINSSMLKSLGKTFKEAVDVGGHADAKALTKDFYKRNVTKMVQETTNASNKAAEGVFVNNVVSKLETLDTLAEKMSKATGKRKKVYKKLKLRHQDQLDKMFNDFHMANSSDYDMVNKSRIDGKVFGTDRILEGMRNYAHDITKNKTSVGDFTSAYVQKKQNQFVASRYIVNALAAASTIGSVSLVPKLYSLVNPVPPGALANNNGVAETPKNDDAKPKSQDLKANNNATPKKQSVSFTGKMDTIAKHFEFNDNQLTPALMSFLSIVGLIVPRLKTAVKRAPEDQNTKKKDYSEIPEILVRDLTSTTAVTFGVPILSKAFVNTYEKDSGFVLKNRPDTPLSKTKKFFDTINPFSKYKPYSLKELNKIYGNVDSPEKLNHFAQFIDKGQGSLAKIFDVSKDAKGVFSEFGLDIKDLAKQTDRAASNRTIMNKMANPEFTKKLLGLLEPAEKDGTSEILKRARSLNSVPTFVSTMILIPALLGIVLPKIVYGMTNKKRNAKVANIAPQQVDSFTTNNNENKINYATLKNPKVSTAFSSVNKHL